MQTEVRSEDDQLRLVHQIFFAAAQAQSKIKILEKLPELQPPEADETETFRLVSAAA